MTCEHEWRERDPEPIDQPSWVETREYYGVQCRKCNHYRGGQKGIRRVTYRQKSGPAGDIPKWIEQRLVNGELILRRPESIQRYEDAMELVEEGRIDAEMTHYRGAAAWGVTKIRAPHSLYVDPLPGLREQVTEKAPSAADWVRSATVRDLEAAARIVQIDGWRDLRWPSRVWTAYLRGDSKAGDCGIIARRLGCEVPRRGAGQWFYGTGTLLLQDGSECRIQGETVIRDERLAEVVDVRASALTIIENRDLAMLHTNGLTMALDGQPSSAQMTFLSNIDSRGRRPLLWTDADAEGVRIARTVRRACPAEVVGFGRFPPEWGLELDRDKQDILDQELRIEDEFSPFLRHSATTGRFWEQERLYAIASLAKMGVEEVANLHPFVQ